LLLSSAGNVPSSLARDQSLSRPTYRAATHGIPRPPCGISAANGVPHRTLGALLPIPRGERGEIVRCAGIECTYTQDPDPEESSLRRLLNRWGLCLLKRVPKGSRCRRLLVRCAGIGCTYTQDPDPEESSLRRLLNRWGLCLLKRVPKGSRCRRLLVRCAGIGCTYTQDPDPEESSLSPLLGPLAKRRAAARPSSRR
jgi:hypothetical protein